MTRTTMTKSTIADIISANHELLKGEISDVIDELLYVIKSQLLLGKTVKLQNFGRLGLKNRGARKGRNPKTGEEILIAPRIVVSFNASVAFKRMINEKE